MSYSEWHRLSIGAHRLSIWAKKLCHLFAQTPIHGWFDDIDEKNEKKPSHFF